MPCARVHVYEIYSAATETSSPPFSTPEGARRTLDSTSDAFEPMWVVEHEDGSYCYAETQRQECLGVLL